MNCLKPIPTAIQGGDSKVVISLDPDTIWRPRGSEVRFTINGNSIAVLNVQVCFAWSHADEHPEAADSYIESPLVRSMATTDGKNEYGAVVPDLHSIDTWWLDRIVGKGPVHFTGLFTVPLSDMQVLAQIKRTDGPVAWVAIVLPVGVTSVWAATVLVILAVVIACLCLYLISREINLPGADPALKVISTKEGIGSLSQFQIILWTFVIGASAVYVMSLSGNLIGITSGTLTLLGIASVTTLLARLPMASRSDPTTPTNTVSSTDHGAPTNEAVATAQAPRFAAGDSTKVVITAAESGDADTAAAHDAAATAVRGAAAAQAIAGAAAQAGATPPSTPSNTGATPSRAAAMRSPQWSDLLIVDGTRPEIDVTRVQMLIFTMVSAAFVAIKVFTSYEIPEIPPNYLLLMGISNGVYIVGRHL